MGAASSSGSRSVSMDNPSPVGVIDVSDEVVQRLKKGISKQAKENSGSPTMTNAEPLKESSAKITNSSNSTGVHESPVPAYFSQAGPTITALDMRRQKELELQQNDAMWHQRMAQLELSLNKSNVIMEKEYSAAVNDVRKRFATAAPSHQLPPCQDLKANVVECYRTHTGETLKCAEQVALFKNCVSINRVKKLEPENSVAAKGA